jgi:uncharacterized membrane protein YqjE
MLNQIADRADWSPKQKRAVDDLKKQIGTLLVIIQNSDATLVEAAHTHLEKAVVELRESVFGF